MLKKEQHKMYMKQVEYKENNEYKITLYYIK